MLSLERMVISMNLKPMLNAYPDSLGGTLGDIVTLLKQDDMKGVLDLFIFYRVCIIQIWIVDFPSLIMISMKNWQSGMILRH